MNIDFFIQQLYQHFNERNIENVIANMTENIQWANGMEGGYVHGHEGVRSYWTRQFTMVSSKVTPVEISKKGNIVKVKVHQVVHDLNGTLLADETVFHFFKLRGNKISRFDIGEKATQ